MNRSILLDTTEIPGSTDQLRLFKRAEEFSIQLSGSRGDLMNSRVHGSEDALGQMACLPFAEQASARILIGGLGMGFTLASSLATLAQSARVEVAELVPGVIRWNHEVLGHCAGHPLEDTRVEVINADVADVIAQASDQYHAILLDVDNGPEGLTHASNDALYSAQGLEKARCALRKDGLLAVWSASPSPRFARLLRQAGFSVDEKRIRAHQGKGARHVIWLATRT